MQDQRDNLAPAEFVAGWFDSSQRDTLVSCIKQSDDLTNALYDAMEIVLKGEKKIFDKSRIKARKNAIYKMNNFWIALSPAMADCGQIAWQIQDQEELFQDLLARSDWEVVYEFLYEGHDIKSYMSLYFYRILEYWPMFAFSAGREWKNIENKFIEYWPNYGENALFYQPALDDSERDDLAPAQFVAGWYLGATDSPTLDDGFVTEVEACLTESDDLTNTLYDAMEYYIRSETWILEERKVKDQKRGDDKMKEFIELLKPAMANCGQIADSFTDLGEKFGDLLPRSEWDDLDKIEYLNHDVELNMEFYFFTERWSSQDYSRSGRSAGRVQSAYFKYGPKEEEQALYQFMLISPF